MGCGTPIERATLKTSCEQETIIASLNLRFNQSEAICYGLKEIKDRLLDINFGEGNIAGSKEEVGSIGCLSEYTTRVRDVNAESIGLIEAIKDLLKYLK